MSGDETAVQKLILKGNQEVPAPKPPSPGSQDVRELLAKIKSPVPNRPGFITAQKTVRTAGTPEQLPTIAIPDGFSLMIKAKKANTGTVFLGFTSGSANKGGTDFYSLAANENVILAIDNANRVWLDVSVANEGVELIVEQ